MENLQPEYRGEFSVEQRKTMTAQMIQEMRKSKKLSQKEVAAYLNIPATTYNTYESGRTEPPIEILVRLSYLFGVPVDAIVMRDRTYSTAEDLSRQIVEAQEQLAIYGRQAIEKEPENSALPEILESIEKLTNAMKAYAEAESVQKAINKAAQDNGKQ